MTSDEVEAVFRRLLPDGCRVVAVAIADAPADWPLPPDLRKAKTSRQREFIAGRWCAARVLSLLGVPGEVGRSDDRAPRWPIGITGSISHTSQLAVAAGGRVGALGIDLEPMLSGEALNDLRVSTIDDGEWQVLGGDAAKATALFSAKEAVFKCLYPPWLEYTDAKLVAASADVLTLKLKDRAVEVRFAIEHGHAFTVAAA